MRHIFIPRIRAPCHPSRLGFPETHGLAKLLSAFTAVASSIHCHGTLAAPNDHTLEKGKELHESFRALPVAASNIVGDRDSRITQLISRPLHAAYFWICDHGYSDLHSGPARVPLQW